MNGAPDRPGCGAARRVELKGPGLQLHAWGDSERPPVLLLHSMAAHSHWWDWVAPRLAERFHVVAVDFRGHGASDRGVPPAYRFDDYVADVAGVLDHLGWTAPLIVGHSMGAYVAARLAATHPDRVVALVIADMLTGWTDEQDRRAKAYAARPLPEFATPADAGARFRLAPPETIASPDVIRHLGETGVRPSGSGTWTMAFDPGVFLHPPPDPWPFLPEIVAPTLVIRGEGSTIMDRDAAARVAAAVRLGEWAEIPKTFHHLIVDDPGAFARTVVDWIAKIRRAC